MSIIANEAMPCHSANMRRHGLVGNYKRANSVPGLSCWEDSDSPNSRRSLAPEFQVHAEDATESASISLTQNQFTYINVIPETQLPNNKQHNSGEEASNPACHVVGNDLGFHDSGQSRTKNESSFPTQGDIPIAAKSVRTLPLTTAALEVEERHVPPNRLASKCSNPLSTTLPGTKLRTLPRSAPRDVETKGKFTIRKSGPIRNYKVPRKIDQCNQSSPSSAEFQCRDGFDVDEVSRGLSLPMTARVPPTGLPGKMASPLYQEPSSPSEDQHRTSNRSPSLGTGEADAYSYTMYEFAKVAQGGAEILYERGLTGDTL